jgi:ribosomal protein S18 acetylase RimI-like enzyme
VSHHPFRGVRWVTALADEPGAAADVATHLVRTTLGTDAPAAGLTLPEDDHEQVPEDIRPPAGNRWCWWWTDTAPTARPGEERVVDLSAHDPRIAPLLAHSPSASAEPGDDNVVRWAGIVAGGELVACAAHVEHRPGVPHLASVVTHRDHRGRGFASDVCARLTRDALDAGAPVVTLGMYTSNDVARGVYTRLGFTVEHSFVSGYLPGAEPAT